MAFRHLRYFVAIAEEGSLARAASRLRIAQPALSRQIHDLEGSLDCALFHRHPHGVELTGAGGALLPLARSVLAALEEAAEQTGRAHAGEAGEVRLALSPYAVESPRVSRGLSLVREAFPGVMFEIHQLQSEAQAAALRSGEIDIGIGVGGSDDPALIRSDELFIDPISCAILPSTHALAGEVSVSVDSLRDDRLIHFPRNVTRIFPQILAALDEVGLKIEEEHQSVAVVHWQVAAGKGWALGLASQIGSPPAGTVAIPFSDFHVETPMVTRVRPSDDSLLVARLLEALAAATSAPQRSIRNAPASGFPRKPPHAVELRHLQAFLTVCQERSLSRGAERLGLTQSGVSRRVAALEGLLDARLIERAGTLVFPTVAGRVLARHSAKLIELTEVTLPAAVAGTSRCRLGIVPTRSNEAAVIHVIRELGGEMFDVTEMLSCAIEEGIRRGTIDVGVTYSYVAIDDPMIESMPLSEDAIECALLPSSHPLADQARIDASQLAGEPFVFLRREDTPRMYDLVLDELERAGFRPAVDTTADSLRGLRGMVAASMGWSVALRSQRARQESPALVAVPINGLHIAAGTQLLWRRDERDRRILEVVEAFRDWKAGIGVTAPSS